VCVAGCDALPRADAASKATILSDRNTSPNPRWSMTCCYNARRNDPYKDSHHPRYTPLAKVDDDAIRLVGVRRFAEAGEVAWLDPDSDRSSRALAKEGVEAG
jgi:ectoine hydroxylase